MTDENFTKRMRALLFDAAGEAQDLNHEYIGTEHLLLALVAARESCGTTALRQLGVDLATMANRVRGIIKRGSGDSHHSSRALLPLTSRAKSVLELAAGHARALNNSYTGTEHLLLGLVAEGKGIAAQVLFESGVDLPKARAEVLRILGTELNRVGDAGDAVPANERPTRVTVVLEFENGATISERFPTTHEAIAFLQTRVT
jgi:ATP-dependent Clp protease ATP-binding subunit ClpC